MKPTVVTRWTKKLAWKGLKILDFGSGEKQIQTEYLQSHGLDVTPYDLHLNPEALDEAYNIIMVSNVINVQPDLKHVRKVIRDVSNLLEDTCSFALVNYPKSPRKVDMGEKQLERELRKHFADVTKLPDRTLVYRCSI